VGPSDNRVRRSSCWCRQWRPETIWAFLQLAVITRTSGPIGVSGLSASHRNLHFASIRKVELLLLVFVLYGCPFSV
jgi:hypothetical protein